MSETLLGVIIGGVIAGVCGVVTAFAQFYFDTKKHKREMEYENARENRKLKEISYAQFINLRTILMAMQYGLNTAEDKKIYSDAFGMIWGEELKKHWGKAFEISTNISLFCNNDIAEKCNIFTFKHQNIDERNLEQATIELDEIEYLMRKDLGIND